MTKLKPWAKNTLLGILIGIIVTQLLLIEKTYETPVGNYSCRGGILQVCSSSNEVANYIGK